MVSKGFSEKAQESLNKIVDKFKTGDIGPIVKIATLKRTIEVPFDTWSFSNRILAYLQSDSLDLRGFNQWKEVGRYVKKGARAAYIFGPRMIPHEEDEKRMVCVGFFTIPVFPIEVTEGDPVDYGYGEIKQPPLLEVATHFGLGVSYQNLVGAHGSANLRSGDIRLATDDEKVFFHELTHAIRIKLGLTDIKSNEDYAKEEVIAEFTAAVLAQMYGRDTTGYTKSYIERYANGNPLKAITDVLKDVEQVLTEIAKVKEMEIA